MTDEEKRESKRQRDEKKRNIMEIFIYIFFFASRFHIFLSKETKIFILF